MSFSPEEVAHRAASDAEMVAWVDRDDQLLGFLPRAQLRARELIGRCTFILLFNSHGQLCVHRRAFSKALYPGFWDVAAGGMVAAEEDYAQSAQRELSEELGVVHARLQEHGRFFFEGIEGSGPLWCAVFSVVSDAPLRLQPEEVLEARFISVQQALLEAQEQDYCPDSLRALKLYLAQG